MKKPFYEKTQNGTRLEIYEYNGGLLGKIYNTKTNECTMSQKFEDKGGKATIQTVEEFFCFNIK